MGAADNNSRRSVSRRKILQGLGATSIGAIAGCSSSGDGNQETTTGSEDEDTTSGEGNGDTTTRELGERVPTVIATYPTGQGGMSSMQEASAPLLKRNMQDALGIQVEVNGLEFARQVTEVLKDQRTMHLNYWGRLSDPARLDPSNTMSQFTADNVGVINGANYVSCEYTDAEKAEQQAANPERRRELVNEAQSIISEDMMQIPFTQFSTGGAARLDEVELNGVGNGGISNLNPVVYIKSRSKNQETLITDCTSAMVQSTNWPAIRDANSLVPWNNLVCSPLTGYDENYDLQNILANSIEFSDDGTSITVELRDATFSNGDTITAEDVKFTFELLWNADHYVIVGPPTDWSIEVIDDTSLQFTLGNPYPALVTNQFPRAGILHKDSWEDATESPEEFTPPEPIVSSGPYEVVNVEIGQQIQLSPRDDHPVYEPNSDIIFQSFQSATTAIQAFRANELHLLGNLSIPAATELKDEMGDAVNVSYGGDLFGFTFYPQHPQAPTKFKEFRYAIAKSINRRDFVDVVTHGQTEPSLYAHDFQKNHPWRAPDEMLTKMVDDPQGNPEEARRILEEAGWGWDDEGNLHYPPDADLQPLWPKGGLPGPDGNQEFACLDNENNYVPPENR